MKKIPSLFLRDPENPSLVIDQVNPECDWFSKGVGVPTRMYDGLCCLIEDGEIYKRHLPHGAERPPGFRSADPADPNCLYGWAPLTTDAGDRVYRKAMSLGENSEGLPLTDGTYELCGPSVGGNPERFLRDVLVRHGSRIYIVNPRCYAEVRAFLGSTDSEGIVWYHPDGIRLAKVRTTDFGLSRPVVSFNPSAASGNGRSVVPVR